MSRPYRLTSPVLREHPLQVQITRLLSIEIAPPGHTSPFGVLWFSVDHAHYAGKVPGTRTRRGIVSGLPDLYIQFAGVAHWIELKAADGRMTAAQREVHAEIVAAGGRCAVARSADEVLMLIDAWHIPRHNRTRFAA